MTRSGHTPLSKWDPGPLPVTPTHTRTPVTTHSLWCLLDKINPIFLVYTADEVRFLPYIFAIYARLDDQNSRKLRVFERKLEGNTPLFNYHLDPIFPYAIDARLDDINNPELMVNLKETLHYSIII